MCKISIIIPAYNAEKHVLKTLDAIVNQTINDFEVIVVNDGSIDNTSTLVESAFKGANRKDIKFKLLRQHNQGVSAARNNGLREASGEYVLFLDSDDLMASVMLEKLYVKAQACKTDIVMCGWDLSDENGRIFSYYSNRYGYFSDIIDGKKACEMQLCEKIWICTGSAIYKRDFIFQNGISYYNGCKYGEDQEFILKALFCAERVACVPESLVKYVQRKDSEMHKQPSLERFNYLEAMQRTAKFFEENRAPEKLVRLMYTKKIPCAAAEVIAFLSQKSSLAMEVYKNRGLPSLLSEYDYTKGTLKENFRIFLLKYAPYLFILLYRTYIKIQRTLKI